MKKLNNINHIIHKLLNQKISRRRFFNLAGLSTAGFIFNNTALSKSFSDFNNYNSPNFVSQVAATLSDNYDSNLIKQKVQHLFESLGGINDIVSSGDKVGIKINLTGGSNWANHSQLNGVDIREAAWTHPEVLRAVTELLIDQGINGNDIFFVEAIWDENSYTQFGYQDIQQELGTNVINLNSPDPYSGFITKSSGSNYFFYSDFIFNQILDEIDVFISIPKMKHHYLAGLTHGMKNLVGITPLQHYQLPSNQGIRSALHEDGGNVGYHLPRSICDLNMARPIHLVINDGIKNADGGEGPWNPTFTPAEYGLLLAGKDPVATDSIAAKVMGNSPEAEHVELPDGGMSDNHLYLANQKGMGTNILSEIELVGDGAGAIQDINENLYQPNRNTKILLYQNFPSPVKHTTHFSFKLMNSGHINFEIFNQSGQHILTLISEHKPAGIHHFDWKPTSLTRGLYFYTISGKGFSQTKKLLIN